MSRLERQLGVPPLIERHEKRPASKIHDRGRLHSTAGASAAPRRRLWYRQTYQAADTLAAAALPERYTGPRAAATAIYFPLRGDEVSHLHRLASDELWHHYAGASLLVHVITPDGHHRAYPLGKDLAAGVMPQLVVPRGAWFGAEVLHGNGFALVGNIVAPGFDFADFELADRGELSRLFPDHTALIERLTPAPN